MAQRFTEEFKIQAVKQVTDHGHSVSSVAQRLGITTSSLYNFMALIAKSTVPHSTKTQRLNS